jgi:hypothetical protein
MRENRRLANLPPGALCRKAIRDAEQAASVPTQLMAAIGRVESGRPDDNGVIHPWPWTINAEGEGHIFETKADAIAAVRALQAKGMRSIDVGCMQVNLMHHPNAFATLDQAFDPVTNATYAARFLTELHALTGDWAKATAFYHSATPDLGTDYARKVAAVWPDERRHLAETMQTTLRLNLANAWSATLGNQAGNPTNQGETAHIVALPPVGVIGRNLDVYRAGAAPVRRASYRPLYDAAARRRACQTSSNSPSLFPGLDPNACSHRVH